MSIDHSHSRTSGRCVCLTQDHEELVAYFLLSVYVSNSDAVSPELIQAQKSLLDVSLGRRRSRLAISSSGIDADLQEALQIMYNQVGWESTLRELLVNSACLQSTFRF